MKEVKERSERHGYWYNIGDILTIMICGMLCNLQTIDDIHEWSKATPPQAFLKEQFGIEKIPCRAQFYNILSCVDAEKFNLSFTQWMQGVLHGDLTGKTVAIDGKTICSTDKLTKDGSVLHIVSAIVSEHRMVIGSHECGTKTGEITAFRELIGLLDVSGAVVVRYTAVQPCQPTALHTQRLFCCPYFAPFQKRNGAANAISIARAAPFFKLSTRLFPSPARIC